MKRSQVNAMFIDQVKRKNRILFFSFLILISFSFVILSFRKYSIMKDNKVQIPYSESSDIDYKVFLKQNDFFNDSFLKKDSKYVASLVDYISADFIYNFNIKSNNFNSNYTYKYMIDAELVIKEKNVAKTLYSDKTELVQEQTYSSSSDLLSLKKNINIDYNYYNDIVKKFIGIYDLDNIDSYLTVTMHVKIDGDCTELDDLEKTVDVSLNIPLTTKTVDISIKSNLVEDNNGYLDFCLSEKKYAFIYLIIAISLLINAISLIIYIVNYAIATQTAEMQYRKELKSILSNYKSFIQKSNSKFDFTGYKTVKIDDFADMLEIRDTINQPILMVENSENSTCFMIPSNTKIVYIYLLRCCDIRKKMEMKTDYEKK